MLAGLLKWHSSYFAAALDPKGFCKEDQKDIEIKEDIEVFELLQCRAYTGRLQDEKSTAGDTPRDPTSVAHLPHSSVLCKLWIFGDMRGVPDLKNAAIDVLHERITR